MDGLHRIEAPHFVAGVVVRNGIIDVAAPILRWSKGKTIEALTIYCKTKSWRITHVDANV